MAVTALVLILVVTTITVESVSGAPLISKNDTQDTNLINDGGVEINATQKSLLLEDGLFEGDIAVTEEFIRQHYNFSSIPGGEKYTTHQDEDDAITEGRQMLNKRAAVRGTYRLWRNATVPYRFSSRIQRDLRHRIRAAMDHWEDHTCLRFTLRNGERDYVEYNNRLRICSSYVGRHWGRQTINMDSVYGCGFGTIVHEIGHTVGFWHEQSRPDRDNYIQINFTNVGDERFRRRQFMKRKDSQVDSRGSEYDYGSVMHYSTTAFVRRNCRGCQSIEVINTTAYHAQGSPRIGQRTGLSIRDVEQANRLYSCPRHGITGVLVVHVKSGQSLPHSDPVWNASTPYVKITAVDSTGNHHIKNTSVLQGTTSPNWNEYLEVPESEWHFFRIQVWDDNFVGSDDKMSVSETIVISQGEHSNFRHCLDDDCNSYVSYDYNMTTAE